MLRASSGVYTGVRHVVRYGVLGGGAVADPRCADAERLPCNLLLDIHRQMTETLKTLCEVHAAIMDLRDADKWVCPVDVEQCGKNK